MKEPIQSGGEAMSVSLNLNLSAMSIYELVTVYRGMRHLSMTLSGLMEMPRSYADSHTYNKAGEAFEAIADMVESEWSEVIDEIISRQPSDSCERHQRDFAIVDHYINETSPMELNLAMASEQIGRPISAKGGAA